MTLEFSSFSLRLRFSFFALLALMLLRGHRTAALCFLSAALHEGGHFLLLRLFGAEVHALTLTAAGAAIERAGAIPLPRGKETLVCLGGVGVNALLCGLSWVLRSRLPQALFRTLFLSNAAFGALNLLPVYPLDLWRALDAALEDRLPPAHLERLLRGLSLFGTAALSTLCVWYFLKNGRNPSLFAVCAYLILLNVKRRTSDV